MDEWYNPREEYIKHLRAANSYDSDGRSQAATREWIDRYEEQASYDSMGGA